MELGSVPLAPDIEYFLDGAAEAWEINAFDHAVLRFFGNRTRIMEIVDANTPAPPPRVTVLRARMNRCLELDRYAHEIARDLSEAECRGLFAASLIGEHHFIRSTAEIFASWNFEDETKGGCLKPFKMPLEKRSHVDGELTPRMQRQLHAPAAIRRYVRLYDGELNPHRRTLAANMRRLPWPDGPHEADMLEAYYHEVRERWSRTNQAAITQIYGKKPDKKLIRRRRKTIRKSTAAAASVLGDNEVGKFIRGQAVRIKGESIVFSVSKSWTGLAGEGHGGIRVDLENFSGERLANLCLYFDGMPALDQLAAVALHVEAGNETHLLDTGNVGALTEAGVAHPALGKRANPRGLDLRDPYLLVNRAQRTFEARRDAYILRTLPIYFEATLSAIWRRDAPKVQRFFGAMKDAGPEQALAA